VVADEIKKVTINEVPLKPWMRRKCFSYYILPGLPATKGVVHSCAGYMIYTTYSFVNVFNINRNIYFCTAMWGGSQGTAIRYTDRLRRCNHDYV